MYNLQFLVAGPTRGDRYTLSSVALVFLFLFVFVSVVYLGVGKQQELFALCSTFPCVIRAPSEWSSLNDSIDLCRKTIFVCCFSILASTPYC